MCVTNFSPWTVFLSIKYTNFFCLVVVDRSKTIPDKAAKESVAIWKANVQNRFANSGSCWDKLCMPYRNLQFLLQLPTVPR